MNTPHNYTDEQLQAAIDAAFPAGALEVGGFGLDNFPTQSSWKEEAPNRLTIARAFLAALPKRPQAQPGPWPGQQEAIDKAFEAVRATHLVTPKTGDDYAPARLAIAQAYDAARPQAAEITAMKAELEQTRLEYSELKRRLQVADERAEKAQAELAALRQPILADDGRSLGQVAFDAGNIVQKIKFPEQEIETWGESAEVHDMLEAAAQAVASVVLAQAVRRMEAVPFRKLMETFRVASPKGERNSIFEVRARLLAAAKGEEQSVVVNEPPQDERQPDLSGEGEKQDPYARLKVYAKAGARIRCCGLSWRADEIWVWDYPVDCYEVHPDDLHMVPEYAPAKPAEASAEPEQPSETDMILNLWGRLSIAVDEIDHKGNNTTPDDVLARLAVFKAPDGNSTLPFFVTPKEAEAIQELMQLQDMSRNSVLRQALRHYQQDVLRRHGIAKELPPKAQEPEQVVYRNRNADWSVAYEEELLAASADPHQAQPAQAPSAPTEAEDAPAVHVPKGMRLLSVESPEFDCLPEGSMCLLKEHGTTYPWEKSHFIGERVPVTLRKDCYYAVPAQPTQSPQDWTPVVGDTVRLKSGGPVMTVFIVNEGFVWCRWFSGKHVSGHNLISADVFLAACLTPAKP